MKKVELLCPAGNAEKFRAAVDFGADAVYFAGKQFGMRASADNFTIEEMTECVAYAHARSAKAYLTVNCMPHDAEYPALRSYLAELRSVGIDALIAADLGVIAAAREILPDAEIHISTQANVVSVPSCLAYASLGAKRIVLARELTLDEIRTLRAALPEDVELEAFIHGSMCIAVSGRCLLSNHFTGRDANRGQCAQPCRWQYTLTESKRPDEQIPIEEVRDAGSSSGTFIMSSKDLCMIEHVPELIEAGIDSFKIEGRMKSAYYTAVTANVYRMAIDRYYGDPASYRIDPAWTDELNGVSHREYGTGFFYVRPGEQAQTVSMPGYLCEKSFLALAVSASDEDGYAWFSQRKKLFEGDRVELLTPGETGKAFSVGAITDADGNRIDATPHPSMRFRVRVPFPVREGDILRGC